MTSSFKKHLLELLEFEFELLTYIDMLLMVENGLKEEYVTQLIDMQKLITNI